jgi:hypothetical protein
LKSWPRPARRALEVARAAVGDTRVQLFGDRLHVQLQSAGDYPAVGRALADAGITVTGWREIPPSLEDVFIARLDLERRERGGFGRSRWSNEQHS